MDNLLLLRIITHAFKKSTTRLFRISKALTNLSCITFRTHSLLTIPIYFSHPIFLKIVAEIYILTHITVHYVIMYITYYYYYYYYSFNVGYFRAYAGQTFFP